MNTFLPLVFCALLLSSCRSVPALKPEMPRPSVYLLTPDQARHQGLMTTSREPTVAASENPISATAVVASGDMKAYPVGRTVDARDPGLLHEAHVVYRRETTPRWRLHAPTDQRILIGPQVTAGAQDHQPLLTKELTAFLNEQRRTSQANAATITALFQAVERIAEQQRALAERTRAADIPRQADGAQTDPGERPPEEPLPARQVKED